MKMNRLKRTVSALALSLSLGLVISAAITPQAQALRTVFDPWNYRQNILTAVRSLTEINQQINQLRNGLNINICRYGDNVSNCPLHIKQLIERKWLFL